LNSLNYGKGQQDRARAFAGNVIGQEENFYGNPFQTILNRNATAGAGAQAQGAQSLIASKVANFLNPESEYAGNVYGSNAAGEQSAENSRASANSALVAGIMSMIGNAAGGAAGFCWVAREVYGASNPRWLEFRHWMLTQAPVRLQALYLAHGPQLAQWLHSRPTAKATVRRWMEQILNKVGGSK
jgi:hypothetical protein